MTLQLEIISPMEIIFKGEVVMAVLPGEEGEFGVIDHHQAVISQLKKGVISIYDNTNGSGTPKTFSISGGFAQTDGTKCTILSDDVEEAA